jgi:hypothetical protein
MSMPLRTDHFAEIEAIPVDISTERFDRMAFARRAVAVVRPRKTTVAFCEGGYHVRVVAGRQWGRGEGERWAIVSVPRTASRRAIALAVADLAGEGPAPYVLDLLLSEERDA